MNSRKLQILLLAAVASSIVSACRYSVAHRNSNSRIASTAEQHELVRARRQIGHTDKGRIGDLLDFARSALERLSDDPSDSAAQSDYNFAVGRIVEAAETADLDLWEESAVIGSPGGATRELSMDFKLPWPQFDADSIEIFPADRYRFRGRKTRTPSIKKGIGAPVIVVGRRVEFIEADPFFQDEDLHIGMTAVLDFEGGNAHLKLLDPLEVESAYVAGTRFEISADFGAPLSFKLAEIKPLRFQLSRLFNARRYNEDARLSRLQPYSPDRIPVLFIHGLGNSPATWMPTLGYLRNHPSIRKRYQFWVYCHPSGVPYPISSADLREKLDEIAAFYPGHKDIVVVGHSMGGMISRLLMTDSGMDLWENFFDEPPDQIPFSPATRKLIESTLIFKPREAISRTIFVSASHRGSYQATKIGGRLGARLIGNPIADSEISREVLAYLRADRLVKGRKHLPNSIQVLDPDSQWLQIVHTLPLDRSIPFHSIMGDRGRGGNLDRTEPQSTDGVVPFWSAHLDGAKSERIVPSGHWSHLHPEGMEEIRRILLEHLK